MWFLGRASLRLLSGWLPAQAGSAPAGLVPGLFPGLLSHTATPLPRTSHRAPVGRREERAGQAAAESSLSQEFSLSIPSCVSFLAPGQTTRKRLFTPGKLPGSSPGARPSAPLSRPPWLTLRPSARKRSPCPVSRKNDGEDYVMERGKCSITETGDCGSLRQGVGEAGDGGVCRGGS